MNRSRLLAIAKVAFGILALIYFFFEIRKNWVEISSLLTSANPAWLALAFVSQISAFAFLPVSSMIGIRIWKRTSSYLSAARIFFLSQPAKYLPGGIWVFPARIYLINAAGFKLSQASFILGYETVALVVSALAVGLIGRTSFPAHLTSFSPIFALLAIAAFIALLLLRLGPNWIFTILPPSRRPAEVPSASPAKSLIAASVSVASLAASWALSGFSVWLIVKGLNGSANILSPLPFVGAFALSWLLGFVIIVSPGGLGVREAALIFLLSGLLSPTRISVAALISRLIWSACEVMLYFFFSLSSAEKVRPTKEESAA